jgi:hypothetical protein
MPNQHSIQAANKKRSELIDALFGDRVQIRDGQAVVYPSVRKLNKAIRQLSDYIEGSPPSRGRCRRILIRKR